MPAGSGTAATHSENCEDVIDVRAVILSSFHEPAANRELSQRS